MQVKTVENDFVARDTSTSLIRDVIDRDKGTRWEEFDRTYRPVILGMARKAGLGHHDAQDLAQDVFGELSESLPAFEVKRLRGSFRRYLGNLIRWRLCRRLARQRQYAARHIDPSSNADGEDVCHSIPAPDVMRPNAEQEFNEAVKQAILALTRDLEARHVQLLELYFCQELSAKEVAARLGMSRAAVFTIAHRHKLRLLREILRRL